MKRDIIIALSLILLALSALSAVLRCERLYVGTIRGPVIPTFECDAWCNFEFDDLTTNNLDATDHTTLLTWLDVPMTTNLSVSTNAERTVVTRPQGIIDDGTRGLVVQTLTTEGTNRNCVAAVPPEGITSFSIGFWFYCPVLESNEYDIFIAKGLSTYFFLLLVVDTEESGASTIKMQSMDAGSNPILSLPSSPAWYWITSKYAGGDAVYLSIYDSAGSLISTTNTAVTETHSPVGFYWGDFARGGDVAEAETFYFDDLVVDWSDATFPLGP